MSAEEKIPIETTVAPRRRVWMRALRLMGTGLLVTLWLPTALMLWTSRPYLLDLASHFGLHAAAAIGLVALPTVALRWWRASASIALAALTLVLASWWNYVPPAEFSETPGPSTVSVIHYNAYGATTRYDEAFLTWLEAEDPDLVSIVDTPWGLPRTFSWIAERYPYRVEPSRGLEWPNLLLSKYPATIQELAPYSEDLKFSFVARRSLLVEIPGFEPFIFSANHLPSPRTRDTWSLSRRHAARDAAVIRGWLESGGAPVLLCTDMNSTPMGRVHREFGAASGLRGWTPLVGGGTYPSRLPAWLSIPIDRIWTSPGIRVTHTRIGPQFDSDHRAIVARLELRPLVERSPTVDPE